MLMQESMTFAESQTLFSNAKVIFEALTFFIHETRHVEKALAIWAQGLLHVCFIFHFPDKTFRVQQFKKRLTGLGVTPRSYSFSKFQTPNAVYIKMPCMVRVSDRCFHQLPKFYIGSTSVGITKREFNRQTRLRQTDAGDPVKVELAIRWWSSTKSYAIYSTIQLQTFQDYPSAWVFEHALIANWASPLNYPLVTKLIKRTSMGFHMRRQFHGFARLSIGNRLFAKVRRRLSTVQGCPVSLQQKQAWKLLYELSLFTKQSFLTSTRIRSAALHDFEVYGLYRLSGNLEEPARSRVRSLIASAMRFRGLSVPKSNSPFSCPFLSHDQFPRDLQAFLRQIVLSNKQFAIPLHLPSCKPRETAFPKLKELLFNFRSWERRGYNLLQPEVLPCVCHRFLRDHPLATSAHGHVATSLDGLRLPTTLRMFRTANAGSTVFFAQTKFVDIATNAFKKWLKHHGLPMFLKDEFPKFLNQQWPQHLKSLDEYPRFTFADVQRLKKFLGEDWVIHHEDHHPQKVMIFCPRLYFQGACRTWNDAQLFQPLSGSAEPWKYQVQRLAPAHILKAYPWGFQKTSCLPSGFVFLKAKKEYLMGRTLISHFKAYHSKLLKACANALLMMLRHCWPQHSGQQSIPQTWKHIHEFFERLDSVDDYQPVVCNDDLVGFFNSIPQDRLLCATQALVQDWIHQKGDGPITVNMDVGLSVAERTFRGKFYHRPKHSVVLYPIHLIDVIAYSFRSCIFCALGAVWKQIRGTGIGNQVSPVISEVAIAHIERTWSRVYNNWRHQPVYPTLRVRYVDNRFMVCHVSDFHRPVFETFRHEWFYGWPVQLEVVPSLEFLGFVVDPGERTITYRVPSNLHEVRDPQSAGSLRLRMSGLKSRAALITRYAWPPEARDQQLSDLVRVYVQKGFSYEDCAKVLKRRLAAFVMVP